MPSLVLQCVSSWGNSSYAALLLLLIRCDLYGYVIVWSIDSHLVFTMTSSIGNIFRVTGPLWGESTGHRWIPLIKASVAELWCFLWSPPEQTAEQTSETPVIWNAIALIMTSLYCVQQYTVCVVLITCRGMEGVGLCNMPYPLLIDIPQHLLYYICYVHYTLHREYRWSETTAVFFVVRKTWWINNVTVWYSQIAQFMGPTWGPPGSCRLQMGPMMAPWTLLSGLLRGDQEFTNSLNSSAHGECVSPVAKFANQLPVISLLRSVK